MPELEDVTYSRTATIAVVSDYYRFLSAMYMKDPYVLHPPPEGWPSIINTDADTLQKLGKSEEVLALLAHLPYIYCPDNWDDDAEAASGCVFADWGEHFLRLTKPEELFSGDSDRLPIQAPNVLSLTSGDPVNPVMILDTRLGIIHWEDCPEKIEQSQEYHSTSVSYDSEYDPDDAGGDSDEEENEENGGDSDEKSNGDEEENESDEDEETIRRQQESDWRHSAPAWAIPDFFEILKDQFRTLHWIPISAHTVRSVPMFSGPGTEGIVPMLQDIYRQHGWPDLASYRKAECLEAVRKALEENYPDEVCGRGGGEEPEV